ncbi:MAG: transpeptidase family protein, partial [Deltaproteobacteria bacterium]|nr:transpeptidase family protein [Deltaproteobacteria bacterium]
KLALSDYKDIIKLPPKRGTIYDRDGHELAVSLEVGSIYANPRQIENKKITAGHLALGLDESSRDILKFLEKDSSFVWVKRRVSPETINKIKSLDLKGIDFTAETRRFYPGKDIAGHLLGFAGYDNQGLEGLEKYYDEVLKAPEETLIRMTDAVGRPFYMSEPAGEGQDMRNLVLTIDKDIQYKAQEALDAQVKKRGAKGGQCIVMDPDTGEILAMALAPSFNPNIFNEFSASDWRNRIITDCYEPGSVIKAFLLSVAFEDSLITSNTLFNCENGEYSIGGRTIHDTKKHEILSASDIVVLSSNIGAVKIGQKVGYERFYEALRNFGLGEKTGVDLLGERSGFVRSPESSREIDKANTFFGHGLSVTSLQLAAAMSSIANGGRLMRPYLVKEMTDQSGNTVKTNRPEMIRRVLSEDTTRKVTQVLENVVSEKGTAEMAAIAGYRVAGKTGTSQKVDEDTGGYSHQDFVSIFVGFVPVDDPEMVILVMVDEPKKVTYGGLVAGPVFSEVGKWALNNMRIKPDFEIASSDNDQSGGSDDESGALAGVIRRPIIEESAVKEAFAGVPDFTGRTIREVLQKGRTLGVDVIVDGTGMAVAQYPEAGSSLEGITSIRVTFKSAV